MYHYITYKVRKSKQALGIMPDVQRLNQEIREKLKKQRNEIHREQYKEARNEYITIRREEQRM